MSECDKKTSKTSLWRFRSMSQRWLMISSKDREQSEKAIHDFICCCAGAMFNDIMFGDDEEENK